MSLRGKDKTTFYQLGALFDPNLGHTAKAVILKKAFLWEPSKNGYQCWVKLFEQLSRGDCDYEALKTAFESEPELVQFIPIVRGDILWD